MCACIHTLNCTPCVQMLCCDMLHASEQTKHKPAVSLQCCAIQMFPVRPHLPQPGTAWPWELTWTDTPHSCSSLGASSAAKKSNHVPSSNSSLPLLQLITLSASTPSVHQAGSSGRLGSSSEGLFVASPPAASLCVPGRLLLLGCCRPALVLLAEADTPVELLTAVGTGTSPNRSAELICCRIF